MSDKLENDKWLKLAGILSEAPDDEEAEDIFGDDDKEDEKPKKEDSDEKETEETEEEAEEEDSEEDKDEEEEKKSDKEGDVEVDDSPTFDTEIDKMLSGFEDDAIVASEGASLTKYLLEKEKRFDIVAFTDNVARVVKNFESLVDYEKLVVGKAEKFLSDNHSEETAKIFRDLISDRHGIDLKEPESPSDKSPTYAVGAVGGGE